jgi:hypothetical protein
MRAHELGHLAGWAPFLRCFAALPGSASNHYPTAGAAFLGCHGISWVILGVKGIPAPPHGICRRNGFNHRGLTRADHIRAKLFSPLKEIVKEFMICSCD